MSKQHDFADASASDDKKDFYESSRTDSGFISGELSEEISEEIIDSGVIEDHKKHNITDTIPEEEDEKKAVPMLLDSGVCLTESFSKISIKEKQAGLNDLNNPRNKPQPLVDSIKPNKNKASDDIPWRAYYEQDEEGDT